MSLPRTTPLRSLAGAIALLAALCAAPVQALVSSTMSYQGVLTDNAGQLVPDGAYTLTFRLYSVPSGGTALWTETHAGLSVNKGAFAVVLGSIAPLTLSFDRQLYLGVSLGADPELVPTVSLTAAPHALSLRLPYTGVTNDINPSVVIVNHGGGHALFLTPGLYAGGSQDGRVLLGGPLYPYAMATLQSSAVGGSLGLWSAVTGRYLGGVIPSVASNTGILDLRGPNEEVSLRAGGHSGGPGVSPYLTLLGSGQSIEFFTSTDGDATAVLPNGAVSAPEILDEPGIAQGRSVGSVLVPATANVADLVSVTITTPAAGYVVVEADAMHGIGGDGTAPNEAEFTIKDTPGGTIDTGNWTVSGFSANAPAALFRVSLRLKRTYFRSAGTHTFYFQGRAYNPSAFLNYLWQPVLTATFIPTSYGAVAAQLTAGDAAVQGLASRAVASADGPGGERAAAGDVAVDLRELELRATRLREQALAAEKAALRARLAQQPVPERVPADPSAREDQR